MTTPINVHNLFEDSFNGTQCDVIFGDTEFSWPERQDQQRHLIEIHLEDQDGYPLFNSQINQDLILVQNSPKGSAGQLTLGLSADRGCRASNKQNCGETPHFLECKIDRSMFPSNLNTAGALSAQWSDLLR